MGYSWAQYADGPALMRRPLFGIACAISAVAGFVLTVWLTDEATQPLPRVNARAASEKMATRRVGSDDELQRIAEQMGLTPSREMAGSIDNLTRVGEGEVSMAGWLADRQGDATPQQLLVYVSGALAAKGETKGERPDLTSSLGLAFGAEKNVRFALNFACSKGVKPVVVGLGSGGQYISLGSPLCP